MVTVRPPSGSRSSNAQPDDRPRWTDRLVACEKVGDSYRGYVKSEGDVEAVLAAHRNETATSWSTRQSPSSDHESTRLMWRSQYVPFDGIPFVNVGNRAIVMECYHGRNRRKQVQNDESRVSVAKRRREEGGGEETRSKLFSVSCPAQICVKKVKKFARFRIKDEEMGKKGKVSRYVKERCVKALKEVGLENLDGEIRWYLQLPTAQAHEFHVCDVESLAFTAGLEECVEHLSPDRQLDPRLKKRVHELVRTGTTGLGDVKEALFLYLENELFADAEPPDADDLSFYPSDAELQVEISEALRSESAASLMVSQRLNPSILTKLRLLVLQGVTGVYEVKHILKNFVEKELFFKGENLPDVKDRSYYPTVIDLQNHIHVTKEALKNGNPVILPVPSGRSILDGLPVVSTQDQERGGATSQSSTSKVRLVDEPASLDLMERRSSSFCEYHQFSPPASLSANQTLAATVPPGHVPMNSFDDDDDTKITVAEDAVCPFSGRGIGLSTLHGVQSYESMHMVPTAGSGLEVQSFYAGEDTFDHAPSTESPILEAESHDTTNSYAFE